MSYNIPKNLFSPDSSGHLQCNDQQLLDVGSINWYDSSVEYTGSVLFGSTLYFQPSTGNGTYLFRGSASTRFLQLQVTTSDATVLSGTNTTRILTRTQNASGTLQWNAGAGTSANMVLSTDELQLRNGADFQRIHIYATYTDSSNYERLEVGSNGVQHRILSQSQGTGTSRSILIGGATVQFNNNITPVSNDTFQCGTSSLRWSRVNTIDLNVTGLATLTSTGTDDSLLLTNTDATSTAAPVVTLKRDSASPSDGDYLGQIKFKGENDAGQEVIYAKVTAKISDVTDTTEDGLIETMVKSAGSNLIVARQTGTALKLINGVGLETDDSITANGDVKPETDSSFELGNNTLRWSTTYTDGIATDVETFAATDTLDSKNHVCLCNATTGNITLNLPVASSTPVGTQYQIKKIDSSSNTVIITPNSGSGDLIDGSATYTLSNQWEGVIIVCDGGDWYVTGGVTNSGGGGGGGGGLGGGD